MENIQKKFYNSYSKCQKCYVKNPSFKYLEDSQVNKISINRIILSLK